MCFVPLAPVANLQSENALVQADLLLADLLLRAKGEP